MKNRNLREHNYSPIESESTSVNLVIGGFNLLTKIQYFCIDNNPYRTYLKHGIITKQSKILFAF